MFMSLSKKIILKYNNSFFIVSLIKVIKGFSNYQTNGQYSEHPY